MKRTLLVMVLGLAVAAGAAAQSATTGQVAGTVTDPTGAVVPGARIVLKSQAGQPREAGTDDQGRYLFTLVPPGVYEMEATASGFAPLSVRKVVVNITETSQVNFELKVTGSGEVVTVTAEVPLLRTDSAVTGRVVQETTIRQLPLPTRNFQQLLTLSAGTSGSIANSSELGRGDAVINVNGQRTTSNAVVINGVDANSIGTGSTPNLAVPATDTLQEFIVQTSLYDASVGRNVGGVVAAVTKSGTDAFHGNAYYFLRRTGLNANNFFLNRQGVERPALDRDQFGGTIGGPIKKGRAWFFGSYQGTRETNGASLLNSLATVFVPQNLSSDRSPAALAAVSVQFGLGGFVHPTAATLLTATLPNGELVIPAAPNPAPCAFPTPCPLQTVTVSAPSTFQEDQFNANIDVQVTDNNRLYGKFFLAENPTFQGLFSFAGLQNALQLPGFGADLEVQQRLLSVGDTHIFNSNLLNDARFGYSYIRVASTPEEPFSSADVGIASPLSGQFPGMPTLSLSNLFDIGSSPFADNDSNVPTYQFSDTLTWTRGRHTLKFGGEYKRNQVNLLFNAYTRGNVFYLGFLGSVFRDFLFGLSGLSIMGSGVNERNIRSSDFNWFIADDWRITPRLTLNLGIRHDYYGPFSDTQGRIAAFDEILVTTAPIVGPLVAVTGGFVQAGNAATPVPGIPQVQDSLLDGDWNNFAPRFGFTWQPLADQRNIVVRGGYGVYYDRPNARAINNQVLSFPYYTLALVFATPIANPFVQVPQPSAFPLDPTNAALFPFGGPPFSLPAAVAGGTTLVPANGIYPNRNNFRTPYVQQYNLGVQWEFAANWLLDLGYVGSSGRKLTRLRSANQSLFSTQFPPAGPLSAGLSALAVQGFGVHLMETSANSNYNSMQVSLNKRFSKGLQFLTSYTWSHSFDEYSGAESGVSDVTVVPGNQVIFNNYASSDFDRRHRFITSFVYDLPKFHKGDSGAGKLLLNDWQFAGIVALQSGTPFSVLTNANVFTQARADFAAGMGPSDALLEGDVSDRLNEYFETSAFANAAAVPGSFGNTPRNFLRGPNQRNLDFSVVKFFPIDDTRKFEFRTEFFNLFNNVNFANPVNIRASGAFGRIVRTSTGPRVIQFAFKFSF